MKRTTDYCGVHEYKRQVYVEFRRENISWLDIVISKQGYDCFKRKYALSINVMRIVKKYGSLNHRDQTYQGISRFKRRIMNWRYKEMVKTANVFIIYVIQRN